MRMGLMITAKSRPYYFQPTLTSWAIADEVNTLDELVIALGRSTHEIDMRKLVKLIAPGSRIWLDSDHAHRSIGMHRAIAEAASRAFRGLKLDALIFGEEDVIVSSDVVKYMKWALNEFKDDPRVLCVLAHNVGGTGWGTLQPPEDADADQESVRLLPYFNPWIWATWVDRWEKILEPNWDYECDSGSPTQSGYDWNIAIRIIPQGNYLCVVPDAARSQTIGREEGWASSDWSWSFSQSQSFRATRENVSYRLVDSNE